MALNIGPSVRSDVRLRFVRLPRQLRGEPGYERSKRTRHSYSRHFGHLDRLVSAINTSETISAKPLRLCTPHPGPITLFAETS